MRRASAKNFGLKILSARRNAPRNRIHCRRRAYKLSIPFPIPLSLQFPAKPHNCESEKKFHLASVRAEQKIYSVIFDASATQLRYLQVSDGNANCSAKNPRPKSRRQYPARLETRPSFGRPQSANRARSQHNIRRLGTHISTKKNARTPHGGTRTLKKCSR